MLALFATFVLAWLVGVTLFCMIFWIWNSIRIKKRKFEEYDQSEFIRRLNMRKTMEYYRKNKNK